MLIIIFTAATIIVINNLGITGSFRPLTERVDTWSVLCSLSFEVFTVRDVRWEYGFLGYNATIFGNLLPKYRRSLLAPA
jgi:hypothetical protein